MDTKNLRVTNVGNLVEHPGALDLEFWIIDCDCCSNMDEVVYRHRDELIGLAKQAGTYKVVSP